MKNGSRNIIITTLILITLISSVYAIKDDEYQVKYVTYCDETVDGIHDTFLQGPCYVKDSNNNKIGEGYLNLCKYASQCKGAIFSENPYIGNTSVRHYATNNEIAYVTIADVGGGVHLRPGYNSISDLPHTYSYSVEGYHTGLN